MSINEISMKARELKELQQLIEEATAEAEAIKDEIKAEMTAQNVEELRAGLFTIRWATVKSSRIDTTAFKKALPDLAQQFTKTTETRRFTLS